VTELHLRVPASTSNLGPGFDCLGLAVNRYLTLEWRGAGEGSVEVLGERPPTGFGDHLAAALREGPRALGLPADGTLRISSGIPVGRGLGSSAALRVGLLALGDLLAGGTPDRQALLDAVAAEEGHPDNAAPALFGGLVAASMRGGAVEVTRLPLSPKVGWAWAAPTRPSSTSAMRSVLPGEVPFEVAIRNASRLAHLIPALAAGDGETLRWSMQDDLHVPVRLPLIPGGEAACSAALSTGAWACTISGAGSGLLSACPPDLAEGVAAAMGKAFRAVDPQPDEVPAFSLLPDLEGVHWGSGPAAGVHREG